MQKQRGYLDMTGAFIAMLVVGALAGILLCKALPWVWSLIKPWLHALTA